jgi:hypothetical protein
VAPVGHWSALEQLRPADEGLSLVWWTVFWVSGAVKGRESGVLCLMAVAMECFKESMGWFGVPHGSRDGVLQEEHRLVWGKCGCLEGNFARHLGQRHLPSRRGVLGTCKGGFC